MRLLSAVFGSRRNAVDALFAMAAGAIGAVAISTLLVLSLRP